MEFFTSGLNLNQPNIIMYENRPFKDVDEMNELLIANINHKVGKEDKLFILGNFIFGSLEEDKFLRTTKYFVNKISCQNLFMLYGNRERRMKKVQAYLNLFKYVAPDMEMQSENGRSLILNFWPQWEWNRKDSIHLYGKNTPQYKPHAYNVSVDEANKKLGKYEPFTIEELVGVK